MTTRSRINLLAFTVIVAGGGMLSAAKPASAAAFTPCDKFRKQIAEQSAECTGAGGTYMWSGSCGSEGYTLNSSCT